MEVNLYCFIRVCRFALCLSSCVFLSAVEKSFSLPFSFVDRFHFPCVLVALCADPSNDGTSALVVLLRPLFLDAVFRCENSWSGTQSTQQPLAALTYILNF